MILKETAMICGMIRKATFAWRNESENEFAETISIWHECLKDEPYEMARQAVAEYIRVNNYPPTVADVYRPYKEYLESKKEKNKRLREIYYNTIDHYPCYADTREIQNEWMRITGNDIGKAEQFKTQLVEYVRGCEMQGIDPIQFEKYMKGVKQIE